MTSNLLHHGVVRANVKGRLVYVVFFSWNKEIKVRWRFIYGIEKVEKYSFLQIPIRPFFLTPTPSLRGCSV